MPRLRLPDAELYYTDSAPGPPAKRPERPTLVLSHGLLCDHRLFEAFVTSLAPRYRCIAYDHRGQGRSRTTRARAPMVDMETLYLDAVALIEHLGCGPCHFLGVSMGGFVGMRLAARRPDLVRSLSLLSTAADAEPRHKIPLYRLLTLAARTTSPRLVVDRVMPVLFGSTFLEDPERRRPRERWRRRLAALDRSIHRAVSGVLYRPSILHEISRIEAPTLALWGEEDRAIARHRAAQIARIVDGAALHTIARAGHSLPVERPEATLEVLTPFWNRVDRDAPA